ncbi:RdgB/HAM1 family non-canonical purine NTP pyrophosphatase [Altericista sp. CCNU0014]|uniref:RdgB/HAM1 family non-canonical purine NTP pyrophosphatase n=1 Tax=Altericista sp. CCNU0014 TaxID=3082949 RepID=UPI00384C7519
MTSLVVATQNPGKLKEFQHHLSGLSWSLQMMPSDLEVEETGQTFMENARLKASQVAKQLGQWAIADDSGLEVAALNGAPGVYSARYGRDDADRIARLLRELGDTLQRSAQFVCALALARPDGEIVGQVEGICPGEILYEMQGRGGFGYDPVFYVPSMGLTYAEMSKDQKRDISHRGRAIAALLPQLQKLSVIATAE